MSASAIEWTEYTWNPVPGCSKVSAGCAHCYAETAAASPRLQQFPQYRDVITGGKWNGRTVLVESALTEPLRWRKPRRIFVNSMGDLFHEATPFEWINKVFAVMALCPQHTFQVLTKRPARMREYLVDYLDKKIVGWWHGRGGYLVDCLKGIVDQKIIDERWQSLRKYHYPGKTFNPDSLGDSSIVCKWPLPNVWLGVTVESPEYLDRAALLLDCPAAVRFVSVEPILGSLDLWDYVSDPIKCRECGNASSVDFVEVLGAAHGKGFCLRCGKETILDNYKSLDWIIVGCETGAGARITAQTEKDMYEIVRQCGMARTPCFVKKWAIRRGGRWTWSKKDSERPAWAVQQWPRAAER